MKSIFLRSYTNQLRAFSLPTNDEVDIFPYNNNDLISLLKQEAFEAWGIPTEDQTLFHNGKIIHNVKTLENLGSGSVIEVSLSLRGGKGGFGSLLRGQAISKRKITNFDASRDLQGRRIRNVKNHQKMIEWAKKKKEEEKMVKKEVDDYNKVKKNEQTGQRTFKLTQEYKDKVDKWDNDLGSSIRAGARKKGKKGAEVGDKRGQDDLEFATLDDFEEPKKKKIFITEKMKNGDSNKEKGEEVLGKGIEEKLARILENNGGKEEEKVQEVKEEVRIVEKMVENEEERNGEKEEKKEVITFEPIELQSINSLDDLVKLGNEHLKRELMRLGLKCGGTLQEKAKRLYDIKLKPELLFDPKYIAKK